MIYLVLRLIGRPVGMRKSATDFEALKNSFTLTKQ
jgi:hypothetical protein